MIIENEELKHFERIRKKEQKRKLRKQKERRKKILNTFCWAVAFLIICVFFTWWFYLHRDMTESNTHEITVKVDNMIVDWESDNYLPDDPYPYVDIISGDITYHAHPPLRIKEFNECSFEEITKEDQVILTVKNSDNLYFVGVRSESKVYYDTEEHYNRFARLQRVGVVIAFCVTGFGYFWFYIMFNHPETFCKIALFLDPPRRKKKPK